MDPNQLAAQVTAVEHDDLQELAKIHQGLLEWAQALPDAPQARRAAARAAEFLERIILRELDDAPKALDLLGKMIDTLLILADNDRFDELENVDPDLLKALDVVLEIPSDPQDAPADQPVSAPAANAWPTSISASQCDEDILAEFVTESMDHIQASEASLLTLESDPADTEAIDAVFRAFHTIKGTSGFLGLDAIQKLAHVAETLLDRARRGEIRMLGGYADLSLEAADMLRRLLAAVHENSQDALPVPDSFPELMDRLADPEAAGIGEDASDNADSLRIGDLVVAQGASRDAVENAATDNSPAPIGQKIIKSGAASPSDVAAALRTQKKLRANSSEQAIRVSTDRLDGLVNLVGELVITQSILHQEGLQIGQQAHSLARNLSHLGKITRELQDLSMSLRMVPLKATFQKMARLVRDLSRKSGKAVQFITEGEDTEIDRNLVESLGDPLVHMIRNAMDHGLEPPEQRQAAGKPKVGTVMIRAYHAAGSVVIELKDDGRGLNADKIYNKAIEKGVIEPGRELSENEIFKLIFKPGFSTAEKVTDVSGRGVGMDVVIRNIESVRGRVDLSSTAGQGTTVSVRVPLTLAIIDGMLVRVARERYILPTINIKQTFRPQPNAISTVIGRGEVVQFQGHLIPVVRFHDIFPGHNLQQHNLDQEPLLVVIEEDNHFSALAVDELLGQQQVVIKSLGSTLGQIPGVSGGGILGDGRIGLILDVGGLISLAQQEKPQQPRSARIPCPAAC